MAKEINHQPVITGADRMSFSLFLAAAFHVLVLLGVTFAMPEKVVDKFQRTLDVVLATNSSEVRPEQADFIAQADQIGGGEADDIAKVTTTEITPFPDQTLNQVTQPPEMEVTKQQVEEQQVLSADLSNKITNDPDTQPDDLQEATEAPDVQSIYQRSLDEIASLEAQLDSEINNRAKKPRRRTVSAATHRATDALYIDAWRRKIERIGNLNYPEKAKRERVYGSLSLKVAVNADGTVNEILVLRSSGHKILDDAAIRIVRLASPFAPLTSEILVDTDILEIIRVWQFQPNNQMNTN